MELEELLDMQNELDKIIMKNKDVNITNAELLHCKVIAMLTEIGEFSNEHGGFKYWKKNHIRDNEKVLEEWVDILFFYLSISNLLGYSSDDIIGKYLEKLRINLSRAKGSY